jgi:hypothetical protein
MRYRRKRRIKIVLLSLGVVLGFSSGIAHLARGHGGHHRFDERMTRVCTEAVKRALPDDGKRAPEAPAPVEP